MARIAPSLRLFHALAAAFAALLLGQAALAAAPGDAPTLEQAAAQMRPGEFAWDENALSGEPLNIVVSRALQRIYVYQGGALVGVSTISTGKRGKETPLGTFPILQKARWHRSNLYSNAPMPFMQRLTWDGIALHAGHLPGYPASHGCIRMPTAFARALFDMTELGSVVSVTDYPVEPPVYLRVEGLEWAALDDLVTGGEAFAMATPQRHGGGLRLDYSAAVFAYE